MAAGTDPLSAELLVTVERALLNAIEGALPEKLKLFRYSPTTQELTRDLLGAAAMSIFATRVRSHVTNPLKGVA